MPIIGREPPSDIIISAPQISARHAEIRHLGGDLYHLTDLNSTNGTWVNGNRISSTTVRATDRISLGSFPFELWRFELKIPKVAESAHREPKRVPTQLERYGNPPQVLDSPPQHPPQRRGDPDLFRNIYAQPGLGTDLAVALAAQKSYVAPAFIAWFLYHIAWIPGFVMNIVYLNEAKQTKRLTGQSPSGMGCLTMLLIFYAIGPLIGIAVLVIMGIAGVGYLSSFFK